MPRDGQRDFDFLNGSFTVKNRRLEEPLSGRTVWYAFDGRNRARPIWDGKGQVDEYVAVSPKGRLEGLTVRLYDPRTATWSLNWASAQSGRMDVPVVGAFDADHRGEFHADDTWNGRAIRLRFIWSHIEKDACRWEQAFSVDGGTTWETNWIMEMTRVA